MLGYGYQTWGWMGSMMSFMGIGMLLFFILLVVASVWGFNAFTKSSRGSTANSPLKEDAGLRVLRERYARGDIDHEEYTRMRDHLKD